MHKANPRFATLPEALRHWTAESEGSLLYTQTADGETEQARLTRGAFETRARAVAAELQAHKAEGERAVLLYPPGLEYVAGFFGCLYAGTIAVPAYPPDPSRLNRTLPRLQAIIADCRADVVLTTSEILAMAQFLFDQAPELKSKRWIATDTIGDDQAASYKAPVITQDTIAFLQYTSGSTGVPKGVILTHDNLCHNETLILDAMQIGRESVVASWLPPYHDMGLIGGILAPLYAGGRAVLMSPVSFLQRPFRWLKAISTFGATISGGPNFAYDLCLRKVTPEQRAELDLSRWRVAFSGAEPVRADTLNRFAHAFGPSGFSPQAFFPCYGLAEGTLIVTGGRVEEPPFVRHVDPVALERAKVVTTKESEGRALVGCGRTLFEQRVAIVDPDTKTLSKPGDLGEIWVQGRSVARGYWQRPEQTEEAFTARIEDTGEGPFLRTGDLGFLVEGELFVAGRAKDLLIIRGKNQYPQDIERTVEECHPKLRRGCSAAFALEVSGEERLAVAVEVERGFSPGTNEAPSAEAESVLSAIRAAVAEGYDVSVHAIALLPSGAIPKTSSGKIQRRETRACYLSGALGEVLRSVLPVDDGGAAEYVAPETEVEQRLATIWSDILGAERIGLKDSFFDLGGHSLLATQAVTRAREAFSVDVTLRDLFESPSLGDFAGHIEALAKSGPSAAVRPIESAPRAPRELLSFAQERVWFLDQLDPDSAAYNVAAMLHAKGALDEKALISALSAIVERHEVLRTTFVSSGDTPLSVVHPAAPVALPVDERLGLSEGSRKTAAQALAEIEARRPFDLERGPLFRARLIRLASDEHVLCLTMHHIVSDGWSVSVLVTELLALYEAFAAGKPSPLAPLPIQYADFAKWQRANLGGDALDAPLAAWKTALESPPDPLDLPSDRPRPPIQTQAGGRRPVRVGSGLFAALSDLSRREDVTLYMTVLAGFATLLARTSGQDDIAVGAPIAGRTRSETSGLIGYFMNTVVLRADLSGEPTFRELLSRLKKVSLSAYQNQEVPFERVVEALSPERDMSRSPLFQAMFILQNLPFPRLEAAGLTFRGSSVDTGTSKFDLTLELYQEEGRLEGFIEHNTDLFDAAAIDRMAGHLVTILAAAAKDASQKVARLPMLRAEERDELLTRWNKTSHDFPRESCLHELFEAQVDKAPSRVAAVFEGEALTYGELEARSNCLARRLRALGVGPDVLVGLSVPRSLDMVVGALGIMKAGGAYVPLDPDYPSDRLAFILEDARASVVVTTEAIRAEIPCGAAQVVCLDSGSAALEGESSERLPRAASAESLVYVIYTSGSTGKPKGVCIAHRALVNFVTTIAEEPGLTPDDRILSVTSLSFDIAGLELYVPLTIGGSVEIASRDACADGALLKARLASPEITAMQATPSTWKMLLDAGFSGKPGLLMLCGGEAMPRSLAASLIGKGKALWNMYGPTETTIWSSAHAFQGDDATPHLGFPLGNTTLHVLDQHQGLVPLGVRGELCIGGEGLARGYFQRPELTAERFVSDPFAEKTAFRASNQAAPRLYRTGDLVRRLADGNIDFIGRMDHQVKVRGFRIELGEIETSLGKEPSLREAVVVVREDIPGDKRLVAYFVAAEGAEAPSSSGLRAALKTTLPDYMVPSHFVSLDALPRTPNGKIDRKALPAPERDAPGSRAAAPPRSPTEAALAAIWSAVLGRDVVSVHEDFFDLGGHSLLATQVLSRVRAEMAVDLPVRALFEAPTIAAMAERIASGRGGASLPPLERISREGALLTSFAQERMWVLDKIDGNNPVYNVSVALRLEGSLDVAALEKSLHALLRRHEALRTSFAEQGGRPIQIICEAAPITLPITRFSGLALDQKLAAIQETAAAEAKASFDLGGNLLRFKLFSIDDADHVLLFTMHHIVSDEWSRGVLIREISALYEAFSTGAEPSLPPLAVQYVDYAHWQRQWLIGDVLEEQLGYWRHTLAGAPRSLDLPADHPRPAKPSGKGARLPVELSAELTTALRDLSRRAGVTLYMTLLAAFDVLLARQSGVEDIVVGTPIANRIRPELEGLIGFFANTVVLRTSLAGEPTFEALLGRVKETCLGAYAHQDIPFERVVEAVLPDRDAARTPLFQVLFVLQNAKSESLSLRGLSLSWMPVEMKTAKLDLGLELYESENALSGAIEYTTDLFDESTVARLVTRFITLLEDATKRPNVPVSRLSLVSDEEQQAILLSSSPRKRKVSSILRGAMVKKDKGE